MFVIALLIAALLTALDQIFKLLITIHIPAAGRQPVIPGLLEFTNVKNSGAAFSMLENQRWLFVGVTALVCIGLVVMLLLYENHEFFSWAGCTLVIGGGLGNMIDRIAYGVVVDYIHVLFFPAIFNFGDCCVTVGAIFLVIHILFYSASENNSERVLRRR